MPLGRGSVCGEKEKTVRKKGICRLLAAGITVLILGTLLPGQYRDLPFALGEEVVTAQEAPDATETPAVTEAPAVKKGSEQKRHNKPAQIRSIREERRLPRRDVFIKNLEHQNGTFQPAQEELLYDGL